MKYNESVFVFVDLNLSVLKLVWFVAVVYYMNKTDGLLQMFFFPITALLCCQKDDLILSLLGFLWILCPSCSV